MKKIKSLVLIISVGLILGLASGCSDDDASSDCGEVTPTYDYTIVDTNQTLCYDTSGSSTDCTGTGQDGAYSGNQPSYTKCSNDEVVIDNNTGLMWQASSDYDSDGDLDDSDKLTQSDADSYCSSLTLDNYDDWRLPTVKEQYSIYLMSGEDLSGQTNGTTNGETADTTGIEPFIDTDYFDVGYGDADDNERPIDGQYGSATVNITQVQSGISGSLTDAIFGLNYVDGHLKSYERYADASNGIDGTYYVRCVRGNTSYGTNSFVNNADGVTVSDNATNLMWQKDDSSAGGFPAAIAVCEGANTGGYEDWRLPNVKELHSIVDYTKSPDNTSSPAIDTTYFNSTQLTNEKGVTDWAYYWSSSALLNYQGQGDKGAYIIFGRGMGYISSVFYDVHGAGAQRSDYKTTAGQTGSGPTSCSANAGSSFGGTQAWSSGPQGDILRAGYNYVRCVRGIGD
ncbi:MAG: DUF1566 domain-containing protein [bacterium]|nr:DUF1566 domain-containing protein [bacterium]